VKTRVQSEHHVPAKSGKVSEVTRSRRERSFELLLQERSALQEVVGELEASRQHYADLFDLAPMGYLSLDRNGCIREINLTGAAMLGRKRTHLLGTPMVPCSTSLTARNSSITSANCAAASRGSSRSCAWRQEVDRR